MAKKLSILIDLSGTLHIDDQAIPGAVEALKKLYSMPNKYHLKFVTNTTKESTKHLHARLLRCGFESIKEEDIFSSLTAARRLIDQRRLRPMFFLEDEAMDEFRDVNTEDPNSVVIGLAPSKFDFDHMNRAFKLLLQERAQLVAIHKSRYFRTSEGLCLGPGPFVECLQFATGKKPTIVGKPEPEFFRQALQSLSEANDEEMDIGRTIMIGDDVRDDVLGAINFGMKGVLVRTGKYQTEDEFQIPEDKRHCVEDFSEAVDIIIKEEL